MESRDLVLLLEDPRVQLLMDLVIPLFICTQRMTPWSRDKSRAVHSAIATLVVSHRLREFRIGI